MTNTAKQAHPTVLLLHELSDGATHVDWLIAQDPRGRDPLISFRLDRRIDTLAEGQQLAATRIGDHRPAYLRYEGPVSGDRGTVARLAEGAVLVLEQRSDAWHLEVVWDGSGGRSQRLRLDRPRDRRKPWIVKAVGIQ